MKVFRLFKWILPLMLWTIAVGGYAHDGKVKGSYTKVSKSVSKFSKKRTFGRHFEVENNVLLDNQEEKDESSERSHALTSASDLSSIERAIMQTLQRSDVPFVPHLSFSKKLFMLHCVYLI